MFDIFGISYVITSIVVVIVFVAAFIHLFIAISNRKSTKDTKNDKVVIDESQEKLKDYSENPNKKGKTITCEYCGSKIDKDAKSCSNCGKKL